MHVTFALLAVLSYAGLISATDVCAQQAKSDPTPNCNAIHLPGLHDIVQGGKPYTIRWGNNTGTSVSLVLCQGDSLDIQEIGCIVDHAPNTGSFVWIPATDLVPDGNHNYGLKIIANTGDFQWSDQFGISNSISTSSSSTPAATPTHPKDVVKESAHAAKQASDGQIQEPTGTAETKKHHHHTNTNSDTVQTHAEGESKTHSKHHTHTEDYVAKPHTTGKHLSAHLVHHEGANVTHVLKHHESQILPSVIATSVTESVAPTVTPSVPATLPAATITPSPATTVAQSPVTTVAQSPAKVVTPSPSTSLKTSFSAGGAARVVATGAPLVLGAMAALML